MAVPPLPPLRIREADASPNVIPVFEIVVSNGTLTNLGGGRVELATGGAGGTAGASTAELYVVIANTNSLSTERALTAGVGITIADSGANAAVYVEAATPFLVSSNRTINTTAPVAGGGNLGADRTLTVDTAFLVGSTRTLTTTYPLAGGGNLSADRTFTVDTAFLVTSSRVLTAGSGLSGGGNLGADRSFSVNTNVRDKLVAFFAAGTLTTTMRAEEIRVYAPCNQELREIRLAVTTTPVGANILVQLYQFPSPTGAGSAFYSAGSRPVITTGNAAGMGSGGGDLLNTTFFAGSWLGFSVDQIGTTSTGGDMTLSVLLRTS